MVKKIWAIALWPCLSLTAGNAFATSIVAMQRPNRITIAADSLTHATHADARGYLSCKIREAPSGGIFFAFSGLVGDPDAQFDAFAIANTSLRGDGSIKVEAKRLADAIRPQLLRVIQRAYRQGYSAGGKAIYNGAYVPALSLLVFGFENGSLAVVDFNFIRVDNPGGAPIDISQDMSACPGSGCPYGYNIWRLGEQETINALSPEARNLLRADTGDDVAKVRDLVNIEIAAEPSKVGGPIDTLVMDASGPRWIEPFGTCHQLVKTKTGKKHGGAARN